MTSHPGGPAAFPCAAAGPGHWPCQAQQAMPPFHLPGPGPAGISVPLLSGSCFFEDTLTNLGLCGPVGVGLWNAVFSACENTFVNMGFGGTSVTVLEELVLPPCTPLPKQTCIQDMLCAPWEYAGGCFIFHGNIFHTVDFLWLVISL